MFHYHDRTDHHFSDHSWCFLYSEGKGESFQSLTCSQLLRKMDKLSIEEQISEHVIVFLHQGISKWFNGNAIPTACAGLTFMSPRSRAVQAIDYWFVIICAVWSDKIHPSSGVSTSYMLAAPSRQGGTTWRVTTALRVTQPGIWWRLGGRKPRHVAPDVSHLVPRGWGAPQHTDNIQINRKTARRWSYVTNKYTQNTKKELKLIQRTLFSTGGWSSFGVVARSIDAETGRHQN